MRQVRAGDTSADREAGSGQRAAESDPNGVEGVCVCVRERGLQGSGWFVRTGTGRIQQRTQATKREKEDGRTAQTASPWPGWHWSCDWFHAWFCDWLCLLPSARRPSSQPGQSGTLGAQ